MSHRSLQNVLNEYLPLIEKEGPYAQSNGMWTFGTRLVAFMVYAIDEERDLAYQVFEVLADSGYDFSKKDPYVGKSPLEWLKETDDSVYQYVLNRSLTSPAAFEAVAFENKFTDFFKKVGKKISEGAKDLGQQVVNFKRGKTVEKQLDGIHRDQDKLAGKNEKRVEKGKEPVQSPRVPDTGRNVENYALADKTPSKLNEEYLKIESPERREKFIYDNLPVSIQPEARAMIARYLLKEANRAPFSNDLYGVVSKQYREGVKNSTMAIGKEAANILITPKYEGLAKALNTHGLSGLAPFTDEAGLAQLKIITYFVYNRYSINDLRKGGKWLSYTQMRTVVNSLKESQAKNPKYGDITPEIVGEYLRKTAGLTGVTNLEVLSNPKALKELIQTLTGVEIQIELLNSKNLKQAPTYKDFSNYRKNFEAEKSRMEGKR